MTMESSAWEICRLCLGAQTLYPIFHEVTHHELYSVVIFTVTGLKVELNDNLPQKICSSCINFINESVKFRKRCEESNVQLLSRLDEKQLYAVKLENTAIKLENQKTCKIDISHLLDDTEFRDYDDNITLDSLKYDSNGKTNVISIEFCKENVITDNNEECVVKNNFCKENTKKTRNRTQRVKRESEKEKSQKNKAVRERTEVECEYCHKILTSKLSLRNHYKIHTGFDVVCEHCGKKFITKRLLLMHCRAKHGYEKTDKCSYCDYRASNAEQVKIHERLHTGEKPYSCGHCSASFHRKSSYLQHVAIHLPEKTVQCDQCPARFKSVTLMRIHKSRHRAATYSFQCRVCDGTFARRRNVVRHLLRVHGLPAEQEHIDRRKIG